MLSDIHRASLLNKKMRIFTKKELAKFNGKNNPSIYIAYKGYVYDVSNSFLWQKGKHQAYHNAGKDLTGLLEDAPHGEEMIFKFPVVGMLKD